jgi:hypothetical protein
MVVEAAVAKGDRRRVPFPGEVVVEQMCTVQQVALGGRNDHRGAPFCRIDIAVPGTGLRRLVLRSMTAMSPASPS